MRSPRLVAWRGQALSAAWAQRWQQRQPTPCPEPLLTQGVPQTLSWQLLLQTELLGFRSPKHPTPEEENAAGSSVLSEKMTSVGTQTPIPVPCNSSASSCAPLHTDQNITSEILSKVLLEIQAVSQQLEEQFALEQWVAVEKESIVAAKWEETPVPALHSTPSPLSGHLGAQAHSRQPVPPRSVPHASGQCCGRCARCSSVPAWQHSQRSSTVRTPTAGIAPRTSLQYCNTHFCQNK